MKYELLLSLEQIEEIKKRGLKVEYLNQAGRSGGLFVSVEIKDGLDLLGVFYAGCYYALGKKVSA